MTACEPVPGPRIPRFAAGYNSFGDWSTLGEIRELEAERENEFPDLPGCPDDTPAIWVTRTPRKALRYAVGAGEWHRIDGGGPLTTEERDTMEGIALNPIPLLPTDVFAVDDGDDGYLVLRPDQPEGDIGREPVSLAPMGGCITTGRRAGYCPPAGASGDFGGAQRLLDEFLFFAVGVDGVVVVPDRANDPAVACHCVDVRKTDGTTKAVCFKGGVVGTLSQDQVRDLCRVREALRHPQGIERRVATFERAAAECAGTHLDNRLDCMSAALKRDGVVWGLGKTP